MVVFFITNFNLMYNGNMENWSCDLGYEKTKAEISNSFSPWFPNAVVQEVVRREKKKERKENTPFKPWLNVKQAQRESITCMLNLAKRWHHLPCTLLLLKLQFLCTLMP